MRKTASLFLAVTMVGTAVTPVLAQNQKASAGVQAIAPGAPRDLSTAGRLRAADADLAWQAQNSKGVARMETLNEQQRLDGLIRDIESGRPVDPKAIDAALD